VTNPYEQRARGVIERAANVDVGMHRFGSHEDLIAAIATALKETVEAETERCAVLAWMLGMRSHSAREVGAEIAAAIRSRTQETT
jgi:predicted DNA-binding transcriptional regulator YafY